MGQNKSKGAEKKMGSTEQTHAFAGQEDGKPFLIYQLGSNNWQREAEERNVVAHRVEVLGSSLGVQKRSM